MKLKVFLNSCGKHPAMVNGKDRDITDVEQIVTAGTWGVPESKLRAIFSEIEEKFQDFLNILTKSICNYGK